VAYGTSGTLDFGLYWNKLRNKPMTFEEYNSYDATALAGLIKKKGGYPT
jgi:hypothetical protein